MRPSAIDRGVTGTDAPAASPSWKAADPSGSTGDHAPSREGDRDARDEPAAADGTTTTSTSGRSFPISRPTVPWPATTSGSSKGWTSTRPGLLLELGEALEDLRGPGRLLVDRRPVAERRGALDARSRPAT